MFFWRSFRGIDGGEKVEIHNFNGFDKKLFAEDFECILGKAVV